MAKKHIYLAVKLQLMSVVFKDGENNMRVFIDSSNAGVVIDKAGNHKRFYNYEMEYFEFNEEIDLKGWKESLIPGTSIVQHYMDRI